MPEVLPAAPPVTLLERRYRGWLRLLPADYRAQWQEDMVETFLAGALAGDEESREIAAYGSPDAAEVASLLGLAVRLRLGSNQVAPRPLLWRQAWQRVALVGLLVQTVWVTVSLPALLWYDGLLPGFASPVDDLQPVPADVEAVMVVVSGWWHSSWSVAGLAAAVAYLLLVHGRRRSAAVFAVLAVVPGAAHQAGYWNLDGPAFRVAQLSSLVLLLLPAAALVSYVGPATSIRRWPWLLAWPAGVAVLVALTGLAWAMTPDVLMDPTGLYCLALALIGGGHLLQRGLQRRAVDPGWALTLAILSVLVLLDRVASLSTFWASDGPADPVTARLEASGAVQAVLVGLVALVSGVVAARAVRSLPAVAER